MIIFTCSFFTHYVYIYIYTNIFYNGVKMCKGRRQGFISLFTCLRYCLFGTRHFWYIGYPHTHFTTDMPRGSQQNRRGKVQDHVVVVTIENRRRWRRSRRRFRCSIVVVTGHGLSRNADQVNQHDKRYRTLVWTNGSTCRTTPRRLLTQSCRHKKIQAKHFGTGT